MTLVYDRPMEGPATHAFVVGCGRYPHLEADNLADRKSPVAGAVAVVEGLIGIADSLIAPLASVEMLVSDPADEGGPASIAERLPQLGFASVDQADAGHFQAAGDAWLDRVRPGDSVVFYFSGHGVVDQKGSAIGLLEDVKALRNRPWAATFDVHPLATALGTIGAESAWVFFDACQEISNTLPDTIWKSNGITLKELSLEDLANESCEPLAIAGSKLGHLAWAPDAYLPPYFTQVLLKGLSGCCVEKTRAHGWAVTGQTLLFKLRELASAIVEAVEVTPQSLLRYSEGKAFAKVTAPFTPVAVRSEPEMALHMATAVRIMDGAEVMHSTTEAHFVWRVDVPIVDRDLTVECSVAAGDVELSPQTFRPEPPSHKIVLVHAAGAP
ncbi:caspase family protein [Xanthobacter autotrophicus]|uniref:caspase family protein n=1 Tax=Xanthobacter autotrophicus TaxID=280 RepID=UPI00372B129D